MTSGRGGGRGGRGPGQGIGRGRGGGRRGRSGMGRHMGQGMGRNSNFESVPGNIPFGQSSGRGQKIFESLADAIGNKVHHTKTTHSYTEAASSRPSAPEDRNHQTATGNEKSLQSIAVIDEELCVSCGICAEICPENAVFFKNTNPRINPDKCTGCGTCVDQCPNGAILLSELAQVAGS